MKTQTKAFYFAWAVIPLILALIFDQLFFNDSLGLSYPFFHLCLLVGALFLFKDKIEGSSWSGWTAIGLAHLLSWTFALFASTPILVGNFLLVPVLTVVGFWLLTSKHHEAWDQILFVPTMIKESILPFFAYLIIPVKFISKALPSKSVKPSAVKDVLLGLVLFSPIVLVVIALLSSADSVFAELTDSLLSFDLPFAEHYLEHLPLILFAYLGLSSLIWLIYSRKDKQLQERDHYTLKPTVAITGLILLNIIYLVFSSIQFTYLFGGADLSFLNDLTYAEYTRKGFFELVFVCFINLGVTSAIVLHSLKKKSSPTLAGLLTVLIGFTGVLLASSQMRLTLYLDAYGMTYLRFFVQASLIAILFYLIFALVSIWNHRFKPYKWSLIITLSLWFIISFINIDARIASYNLQTPLQSEHIDLSYLTHELSTDAFTTIVNKLETTHEFVWQRQPYGDGFHISYKLKSTDDTPIFAFIPPEITSWKDWSLSHKQTIDLLNNIHGN
jgi:hypothetical protein